MSGFRPIAIVGQACLLPGAHSPEALWQAVRGGRDLLGHATAATWQVADPKRLMRTDAGAPPAERIGTTRGGFVTGFSETFDPAGYGLDPAQVAPLDPLCHWLLYVGREALRDAGIFTASPAQSIVGGAIIGNLSYPTYGLNDWAWHVWSEALRARRPDLRKLPITPTRLNRFMSGLPAALLCESLGLSRGGFTVDAACASSLYAIKYACDWLHSGRADVMLAGGVARVNSLTLHSGFTTLQALSPSGRSRPLHAQADGLIPSEGAAVVVLKRLEDAQRDGSRILGVIRGVGLANDGRGPGLLVPSAPGQVRAMRAAYEMSGLGPSDIDAIELHATGTSVGDAVELRSCAGVFAGTRSIALGSLKSNLGHLLPVAGAAGLIKVLKSMEHGERAAILHLDEPSPVLAGTPFAPDLAPAEWTTHGIRRAAVNAFGFGGNNAHLLVEQSPAPARARPVASPPTPAPRLAIVSIAARVGDGADVHDFIPALLADGTPLPARATAPMREVHLPLVGSAFPPKDLEHSIAQQTLTLELAHQALAKIRPLPAERTSVFVGMGCDPELCRFSLSLRLGEFLSAMGTSAAAEDCEVARQRLIPGPFAATTLGCMPNIVANRLNRQFDFGGPSCAVSAEELSGLRGLELATHALVHGEIDAALVGAVDLGREPVHQAALGSSITTADGACLLVLKREADARRDGDTIYALIDPTAAASTDATDWAPEAAALRRRLGVCHSASALLDLAAAALVLKYQLRPALSAIRFSDTELTLHACADQPPLPWPGVAPAGPKGPHISFPVRKAPVVEILTDLLAKETMELMPAAPALRPVRSTPRVALDLSVAETTPPPAVVVNTETSHDLTALHEVFLEELAAAHTAFLAAIGTAEFVAPAPALATEPEFIPVAPPPPAPAPVVIAVPAPVVAAVSTKLPGPKFSREQLIHLAGGKISDLFGPQFAGQDGFARQVRMPLPPMLLADRVTGIKAQPGKLGTGTIWTESDVTPDAWYLHNDRMPVGITIEAGQADLLLISWMGIDAHNRSDRIYRLLGCEARVVGSLPKVGDTLKFDIHIDGHAQLGGIRMFFFHSDLHVNGELRLSVRSGQAGFFSDEELAHSEGVLWDAATEAAPALRGSHDAPRIAVAPRAFDRTAVSAFAAGRVTECFGPAFARTESHSRTPRIQSGRMQFIEEVTHFDSTGGPWGRGYLRAVKTITPDLWFFEGHFKNDPCMPGTLMLEGAVQAMAFYLTALGCTVRADGWRFEPTPGENVLMRCRGQCSPTSRELLYEVFVEEFTDGAVPRLRASVMASVDGKKGFLCQNLSLDLVPDYPLDELLRTGEVALLPAAKPAFTLDGFSFDHRSLLACALGAPSKSFGPGYASCDGPMSIPRLPRPPYHFVTRIDACEGTMGRARAGMWVESDFAFAADAWYFSENAAPTMPACVFMEALLQPCGWLASFGRDVSGKPGDVFFRNLDGKMDWTAELPARAATLRVRVELTNWSVLGTMIIVSFRVQARVDDTRVASMETSFGFFPADAFANQAGLTPTPRERDYVDRASDFLFHLRGSQLTAWPVAGAELANARLLMLDRLTGWWPEAGEAGLGIIRGEKDVVASDWFFKAHFMQDPVQPGSLGIEALLQLLQAAMRLSGLGANLPGAQFEPVAFGETLEWKYRGQIVPTNQRITSLVEIFRIETSDTAITAHARGALFVDGKKVYDLPRLAMRVRASASPRTDAAERTFSMTATPWLDDHRPSFTAAVVPLTVMLDDLASAARRHASHAQVTEIGGFFPSRWLACANDAEVRTRIDTAPGADGAINASLAVWRQASRDELSRFDVIGETTIRCAAAYGTPPVPLPELSAPLGESPYVSRETTHGPAFRLLRSSRRSAEGVSCVFDAAAGTVPVGRLHPALLDACTHPIPFSQLALWYPEVPAHFNGLPRGIHWARFYGPTPTQGEVRGEVRPRGTDARSGLPLVYAQFIVAGRVWCELLMEIALFDATPFVGVPLAEREAFLRRGVFHPQIRFSHASGAASEWQVADLHRFQWMPRQIETLFQLPETLSPEALALALTAQEHVGHALAIHPAAIQVDDEATRATSAHLPLQFVPLKSEITADGGVRVADAGPARWLDDGDAGMFRGEFLQDVSRALRHRYVRHFREHAPAATAPWRGRPVVICSNHQTALESMIFTDLYARWSGVPVTTVTRQEHRESWMGRLTEFLWNYPGRTEGVNPQLLFDRDQPSSFFDVMARYKAGQAAHPHSLHLHVEGEQGLTCRQRVRRMSSVLVDVALDLNVAILPLRFSGGLPVEPLPEIISFPFGYGRQDFTFGAPLEPELLRSMPRPKAAELVVEAINQIPPSAESEVPLVAEPEFAARVHALSARHGVTEIQAGLILALQELPDPTHATRAMLAFPEHGATGLPGVGAERLWHESVADWLWGRDARVSAESENWKRTAKV